MRDLKALPDRKKTNNIFEFSTTNTIGCTYFSSCKKKKLLHYLVLSLAQIKGILMYKIQHHIVLLKFEKHKTTLYALLFVIFLAVILKLKRF